MRIYGPNGMGAVATAPAVRRAPGKAFSLDEPGQTHQGTSSQGPRALGNIDALMALQGIEDATERRRRAVKRGRSALDALETLKLGLLAGRLDGVSLARLKTAAAELAEASGDPGLDAILAEIGLRVEVELAKVGVPNQS